MMQIHSYLSFNGNCREAMQFYKSCLGGELTVQTVGSGPVAEHLPQRMKDYVLHATLKQGPMMIMGSDMVGDEGLNRGNGVSMLINCSSEIELRRCYDRLSAGSRAQSPIEETAAGALFGQLTDKYGNSWLLNCQLKASSDQ
ncbi:Glyoxalase/bleomycin resistance protein/dioxygenase [Pedobacter sp. BAL39]|uniref:VOC family protein n=1 Tax=Pedobacter sp. BAL39 TaxID=391596 RepID=UPI000155A3B4|nr:VOC family protein [Pedobacter sp. BAL39]EDM34321.1 Glyoxalase/bleomycin resistance protein/dioxygenase [Pedobacter sp. BAL39]